MVPGLNPGVAHTHRGFESLFLRQELSPKETNNNENNNWRCVREAYGARLESECGVKTTVGSNPSISATPPRAPTPVTGARSSQIV